MAGRNPRLSVMGSKADNAWISCTMCDMEETEIKREMCHIGRQRKVLYSTATNWLETQAHNIDPD